MKSCKDIDALIDALLDKTLPFWKKISLKIHIFICKRCKIYLQQYKIMMNVIRKNKNDLSSPSIDKNSSFPIELENKIVTEILSIQK